MKLHVLLAVLWCHTIWNSDLKIWIWSPKEKQHVSVKSYSFFWSCSYGPQYLFLNKEKCKSDILVILPASCPSSYPSILNLKIKKKYISPAIWKIKIYFKISICSNHAPPQCSLIYSFFCCRNWQPTLPEKLFVQETKYWGVKLPFYLLHPI